MASKDEMEFEIMRTITIYEDLIEESNLNKIKLLSWAEEMTSSYENLRKAYKFIHGPFLNRLKIMKKTWKIFNKSTWKNLKLLSASSKEVKQLRQLSSDVKYEWSLRPKPTRKR